MPIDNSSRFPKPLAADLLELSEGMAIVIDGDTAPKAITAGQYLFIKNHSTLVTGGYHATAAIASGASITSSNVAADADGVVNGAVSALNGNLANFGKVIKTVTSDGTKTFAQIMKSLFSNVKVPMSKMFIKHSTGRIFRCFNENAKEFIQIDGFDVGYANLLIRVITSNGYYEASNTLTLTNYSSSVVGANQTWSLITYG